MKYSTEGVPNNLFEVLKNAETFELYFQDAEIYKENFDFESKYLEFRANRANKNPGDETKNNLISALQNDIEKGGARARCWIPHHGIRAVYNNQLVQIAICFWCSWFRGEMLGEGFYGNLPDEEESESKIIFDELFLK